MADQQARTDENRIKGLITVETTNGETRPLLIDSTNGRVLIDIESVTEPVAPVLNTGSHDANKKSIMLGWDGASVFPWHIDSRNGLLWVDVIFE